MAESDGTSRRGILAMVAVFAVGIARFGEDLLRAVAKARHPIRGIARSDDDSNNEVDPDQESGINTTEIEGSDGLGEITPIPEFNSWTVKQEITIEASRYYYWDIDVEEEQSVGDQPVLNYDILVRSGAKIDFFLLEKEEFKAFEKNDNFRYQPPSELETFRAYGSKALSRGTYYIVINNPTDNLSSSESSTKPDSVVSVEMSLENGR